MMTTPPPVGPWLGYYENPIPIRRMGAFFLYRATRDGQPRVVAVSRPELDPLTARTIIRRAVQIHLTVRTAAVPLPAERGAVDDLSFVAFNCDAVCDLAHILDAMGDPLPSRLPIDATSALLHHTADALAAMHAARTSPMIAGRLSPAQILFSPKGEVSFIGLGSELISDQGPAMPPTLEAPEYAAGQGQPAAATTADTWLLGAMASLCLAIETPRPAALRMRLGAADADPNLRARWRRLTAEAPELRYQTIEAAREALSALWPRPTGAPLEAVMGALAPTGAKLAVGRTIAGRYRLESRMGFGRRGAWFVAWDRQLQQTVAIKWLGEDCTDQERARLLREVNLLRTLRHPHVMSGYDVIEADGRIGAVVEYVPGEPLNEVLRHDIPPQGLAATLAGIADALTYFKQRGVVHRDIKPANIILNPQREAVLVDLGLARPVGGRGVTLPDERLGTYRFMAPEQLTRPAVGPAADVFSFCMVLVDLLAPVHVINHPSPEAVLMALQQADVPEVLARLIAAGVDREPLRRPAPAELSEALRALEAPHDPLSAVVVAVDGAWMRVDNRTVDLRRRGSLKRILAALADAHARGQAPLDTDALLAAGWPGERMSHDSGRNRVYTAVSTLRAEGLRPFVEKLDGGYRFAPSTVIHRVDGDTMPPTPGAAPVV